MSPSSAHGILSTSLGLGPSSRGRAKPPQKKRHPSEPEALRYLNNRAKVTCPAFPRWAMTISGTAERSTIIVRSVAVAKCTSATHLYPATSIHVETLRNMENFINLGKQFLESQQGSQVGGQGGQVNHDEVVEHANREGSGDRSLFSSAMSFVQQHQEEHDHPIDEQHVINAHDQAYSQGNASGLSAHSMGSAAALQTLKRFTSNGSGGGSQSQLISMAMAEASKLFDSAGGASSGNKQDAVNSAAMTVMKLLVQSKFSSNVGGGNSGGFGGLLGLAIHRRLGLASPDVLGCWQPSYYNGRQTGHQAA
ncbi:hypothetical protein NM688_g19 [Phlebia brevispora]|uniref:Uncharacterized protein n=1 Tax=Phlebia brevispora TaxID=194682 RepID=A0ACC1TFW1_9APHY|nr:hypothetical protein NM688_g19 [Phlebia brevispora]